MPRVDFYILRQAEPAQRVHFCCRLAARAWREGLGVWIRTRDASASEQLDEALWTFDEASFIPHGTTSLDGDNPIVINHEASPGALLINLADSLPEDWQERDRIAEIITADEATRQAGRVRYRDYQQAGATPQTHRIEH
ncbi:DNA polymerase III subunit chi [Spiribacter vilamensis]|uniref:DNA polymerase III chi subunit n=2 Tax=Spiribacter vilamensis TaxID=531306 RepID=A0A4Q8D114_9GAMM|nr:DNA polymerase III subunit chi [Spiribacter vilamensis]RZU98972.1 DNA polymerase III chi subunit [Spiribacter vilamensis]